MAKLNPISLFQCSSNPMRGSQMNSWQPDYEQDPPPSNWNRSLFGWIIKSSITFVWLFVVRGENVMMGGFQCFVQRLPSQRDAQTFFLLQWRNWNWALFNSRVNCPAPNSKPTMCNIQSWKESVWSESLHQALQHFFQCLKLSNAIAFTFGTKIILCQKSWWVGCFPWQEVRSVCRRVRG